MTEDKPTLVEVREALTDAAKMCPTIQTAGKYINARKRLDKLAAKLDGLRRDEKDADVGILSLDRIRGHNTAIDEVKQLLFGVE